MSVSRVLCDSCCAGTHCVGGVGTFVVGGRKAVSVGIRGSHVYSRPLRTVDDLVCSNSYISREYARIAGGMVPVPAFCCSSFKVGILGGKI